MKKDEISTDKKKPSGSRTIILYVVLATVIFFGVQQYNKTVNAPLEVSFTEFKQRIQDNEIVTATIKAQSNTVEYQIATDSEPIIYMTEYPEGFEGEVFQLLINSDIELDTDTEPPGLSEYLIGFLPWILIAGFMFYMFSQVRNNGNQIMQFGKSKARELDQEAPKITFDYIA